MHKRERERECQSVIDSFSNITFTPAFGEERLTSVFSFTMFTATTVICNGINDRLKPDKYLSSNFENISEFCLKCCEPCICRCAYLFECLCFRRPLLMLRHWRRWSDSTACFNRDRSLAESSSRQLQVEASHSSFIPFFLPSGKSTRQFSWPG